MPTPATNLGSDEFGRLVRMYHRPTNAKRGPKMYQSSPVIFFLVAYRM